MMDKLLERYCEQKQKLKELEQELSELRAAILAYCEEKGVTELELERYRSKVVEQARREFDDSRLLAALPDPELWKLLSKTDSGKVASLLKLGVLSEEQLAGTYAVKKIKLLQVEKR